VSRLTRHQKLLLRKKDGRTEARPIPEKTPPPPTLPPVEEEEEAEVLEADDE
jgi:hypothetical protein